LVDCTEIANKISNKKMILNPKERIHDKTRLMMAVANFTKMIEFA